MGKYIACRKNKINALVGLCKLPLFSFFSRLSVWHFLCLFCPEDTVTHCYHSCFHSLHPQATHSCTFSSTRFFRAVFCQQACLWLPRVCFCPEQAGGAGSKAREAENIRTAHLFLSGPELSDGERCRSLICSKQGQCGTSCISPTLSQLSGQISSPSIETATPFCRSLKSLLLAWYLLGWVFKTEFEEISFHIL